MAKFALFETIKGSASEALVKAANSTSSVYNKGGKQAILVNNVNKIPTGWRVQARVNLSQFAPSCIIKKSGIGEDTHGYFTFTVNEADLNDDSKAVLAEFDSKLAELEEILDEGKDPRFDGITPESVFNAETKTVTLPPKAGFGYPHVIVPMYLGLKIEYITEGKVNAYHKVTNVLCPETLQFGINSGGVTFSASEEDFLADLESSVASGSGSTGVSSETVNNDAEAKLLNRRTRR